MAKRGETRPWRVQYEWASGIKGSSTHSDRHGALGALRETLRASHHRDAAVTVTVLNRESGKSWGKVHDPKGCEIEHDA